jgi:hypothetical protein
MNIEHINVKQFGVTENFVMLKKFLIFLKNLAHSFKKGEKNGY